MGKGHLAPGPEDRAADATDVSRAVLAAAIPDVGIGLPSVALAFGLAGGFAANGYGAHSPGRCSLAAGPLAEVVLIFMFVAGGSR